MKKLFIIKTGITFDKTSSLYGDFDKWVIEKLDNKNLNIEVIDIHNNDKLPLIEDCDAVIITGSHSMVTDEEPWSVEIEKWIPLLVEKEIPTLGICYGHQLIAKALNGKSTYHKNGLEIGTVNVTLCSLAKDDILFGSLPIEFKAHTIHSQTVETLPNGAVNLAYNNHDNNHAFRVSSCIWGVQFHPEYDEKVMKSYIQEVDKTKHFEKKELETYLNNVEDTPYANLVLKKFGQIVEER